MVWIKTGELSPENKTLMDSMEASFALYPAEYQTPVESLRTSEDGKEPASIVMAHSLIPEALRHAFSTFGHLMSPDLPLSRRDHELIATTVSSLNECFY